MPLVEGEVKQEQELTKKIATWQIKDVSKKVPFFLIFFSNSKI